jgi:hypothetical protein
MEVVNITAQQGTTQDLGLVLNVPVLEIAPDKLAVTHQVGDVTMQTLTITNDGPAPLISNSRLYELGRGQLPNSGTQTGNSTLLTQQASHQLFLPLVMHPPLPPLSSDTLVFNLFTDNSPLLSLALDHEIPGIQQQYFQANHDISNDYWSDGGNDAFDNFGYPTVQVGGISKPISMRPGEHSYSFNGYPISARHDFPEQNVYRMIIESDPNAPARSDIFVGMSGRMGTEGGGVTFEESFTPHRSIRYFVHNDFGGNRSGAPQVVFLLLPSQAQDLADVTYRHSDNDVSFDVSDITLPATIYMVVSYHDITDIEQWFRDDLVPIVLSDWEYGQYGSTGVR